MSYTTNWTSTGGSHVHTYYYDNASDYQHNNYIQIENDFNNEPTKIPEQIWYYTDMSEISRLKEEVKKMKDTLRIILDCLKLNPYHTKEIIEDISMLIDDYIDTEEDVEEEFITDKDLRI